MQSNTIEMKRKIHMIMSTIILSMLTAILISFTGCEETAGNKLEPEENLPNITGFPIVGTNQTTFFDNSTSVEAPLQGEAFYGQNANYHGHTPQYVDNGDGTVTDMVTGLM